MAGMDDFTFPPPSAWDSPVASGSRPRGHSRHSSTSSIPPYVPVNTGRRGSTKDPEALQAALDRQKNRKRRTNSTASASLPTDEEEPEVDTTNTTNVLRQRQEDARLIRCDAEQQRRNELGKGYDRLRSVLNRGDERLSKYRVVERATARVVQLRDQNERMEDELRRKQDLIRDLNRANEQLMLDASGAAPLIVSSPHSASSSSGRPGSSSHTSANFVGHHDRSSSLPTPPHTYTGLQHLPDTAGEFGLAQYPKQDQFAYNPAGLEGEPQLYPAEFYAAAPHALGVPRSESPQHMHHPFLGGDDQHWPAEWNVNATGSGLPGTFTDITAPAGFTTSSSAYGQP